MYTASNMRALRGKQLGTLLEPRANLPTIVKKHSQEQTLRSQCRLVPLQSRNPARQPAQVRAEGAVPRPLNMRQVA